MNVLGNDVAPIGMGCWPIGGPFYSGDTCLGLGKVEDTESIRTLHAAYDKGIRLFDTAAVYGAGHSERLLGRALADRSDVVFVSKLGLAFDEKTKQVVGEQTDPEKVAAAVDSSLYRLKRDCIDIMLLHLNDISVTQAESIFEKLELTQSSGKIRAFGWSSDFPERVSTLADMPGFICVEHAMNVFVDVPSMQSVVNERNLIALIRSPLAMGILSGNYSATTELAKSDHRAAQTDWNDYFSSGKVTPKYLRNLNAVRELLQTGGRTLSQGALCWLLAKSPNNIPLPGARTVKQIEESAQALEFGPLPDPVMAEIEALIDRDPEGEARPR